MSFYNPRLTNASNTRINTFIDWFVRSEEFTSWQNEEIESGSYSRDSSRRERYARCYDATENGADGSTHFEHINDTRNAFRNWINYDRKNTNRMSIGYTRFESAVFDYFDNLELWHERNGSLHSEIG
jgi:hypothetical protein